MNADEIKRAREVIEQPITEETLEPLKPEFPVIDLWGRISGALRVAQQYGGIDGDHHKAWVIDQMVRELTGDKYEAWICEAKGGEDGPDTYGWNEGIAP